MKFQVNDIQFDFITDDDELQPEEQLEIINQTCERVWYAEDEDDLVDEITWETGWCVNSLEYIVVPDEEILLKSGRSVFV